MASHRKHGDDRGGVLCRTAATTMLALRLALMVISVLQPGKPDTSPCGTRAGGGHRKPSSGCDMFWQDGASADIPGCGKYGRGLKVLDDGVRCGDKRYPLG